MTELFKRNYISGISAALNGETARMIRNRKDMMISLVLLAIIVVIAIVAPLISPYDPGAIDPVNMNLPPSSEHPMGTDYLGRDLFSRIIAGATTSLSIASGVVALSVLVGVALGCIAGFYGGIVDETISRIIDLFLAFPPIIFALAIMGVLGTGIINLIIALSVVQWATYARLIRGQVLSVKKNEYVLSAKMIGAGDARIMRKHIIPNSIAPIVVLATVDFGHVILSIAALSFLGIGLPADVPEWGAMLNTAKGYMRSAPLQTVLPGIAITLVVVIFSILGDGMRDILDPHDRGGDKF